MIDVANRHLVAVDAGSSDPRVVVCMPPTSLSKDEALAFAAHLVAKANAALHEKGQPISTPRTLYDRIDARTKSPAVSIKLGPDGFVRLLAPIQFLSASEAIDVAASLVVVADPEANMLERVSAVVEDARGGAALSRELADERAAKINLSEPRKAVRLAATDGRTRLERAQEETAEDAEPHGEEADDAMLRRMKGGA